MYTGFMRRYDVSRKRERERELQLTIEIKTRCSKVSRGTRDCAEFRSGAVLLKAGYRERERVRERGVRGGREREEPRGKG